MNTNFELAPGEILCQVLPLRKGERYVEIALIREATGFYRSDFYIVFRGSRETFPGSSTTLVWARRDMRRIENYLRSGGFSKPWTAVLKSIVNKIFNV